MEDSKLIIKLKKENALLRKQLDKYGDVHNYPFIIFDSKKFLGDVYHWSYDVENQTISGIDFLFKLVGLPIGETIKLNDFISKIEQDYLKELLNIYIDFSPENNGKIYENTFDLPNGIQKSFRHSAWLIEENGKRKCIFGVVKDISSNVNGVNSQLINYLPKVFSHSEESYLIYSNKTKEPVFVSPNFLSLFNITPDKLTGFLSFFQRNVASSDRGKFEKFRNNALKSIEDFVIVRFYIHNKIIWIKLKSVALQEKDTIAIIVKNVTNEQTNRDLLDESENKYQTLINQLPFVLLIHKDGIIKFANVQAKALTGSKRFSDLVGRNILELIPEEFHERNLQRMQQIDNNEDVEFPVEEVVVNSKGIEVPVKLYSEKIIFNGEICHQLILQDLTQEKTFIATIEREKVKFQQLLDIAPVITIILDETGKVTLINKMGSATLGLKAENIIGKQWFDNFIPLEKRQEVKEVFSKLIKSNKKEVTVIETPTLKANGKQILIEWHNILLRDNNGNVTGILSSGQDVTYKKEYEQSIKQQRSLLRLIVDKIPTLLAYVSNNKEFLYVNKAYAQFYHHNCSYFINKKAKDVLPKDYWDFVKPKIDEALSGKLVEFENERVNSNGEKIITITKYIPHFNEDGKVIAFLASIEDVTERVEREKENKKLSTAIEQSPISVIITNLDGDIEYVNPFFTKITGYEPEEVIGKNPRILKSGLTPFHTYVKMWNKVTNGDIWFGEFINKTKSGKIYTESCSIVPIKDNKGNITNYVALKEDITKKREDQLRLAESENRFKSLFYENESIMILFNPTNGNIIEANQAACNFYGYSLTELTKKSVFEFNTLENDKLLDLLEKVREGKKNHFIFKHQLKNGEVKDVELYTGVLDTKGEEVFYSIIHDITDSVKTKEELVKAKEKAEESDRLKSAFLANMSHEIRTPMNAILGFGALLQDDDLSKEERDEYIDIINSSGNSLLEIINDIIEMSKIEAGQITINKKETVIDQIVSTVYNQQSISANKKNIELRFVPDNINRHITAMLDETKIKQILSNLVNNAIKFTDEGYVEMGYKVLDKEIEFYVKDTGIGISKENHHLVFDRFNKITWDTDGKKIYPGTGLGLSISKAFVEKMGGKIFFESEKGKGTTFHFVIPLEEVNSPLDSEKHADYEGKIDLTNRTILVAEDVLRNYQFLEVLLTKMGAKVLHAFNGKEAVEITRENHNLIDLILMDIKMPGMNGYEATGIIKKEFPSIPVIAQTAYAFSEDKAKAIEAGCDGYISKPIKIENLTKLLKDYF